MKTLNHLATASPLRIGLLGGSFNPPHEGHVHITLEAIKRMRLDYVIWIVSPENPFKDPATLAPFAKRYQLALDMAQHPKIIISDVEQQQGLRYTADTLSYIKRLLPQHQLIWLMGADNLPAFHRWERWLSIIYNMPLAVFDRAPMSHRCLRSHMALRFAASRQTHLAHAPSWQFHFIRRHPESATRLRKTLGKSAFLRHT